MRKHLNFCQTDTMLNQNKYVALRQQAKQLAYSELNHLPEAQRILLIFPEPWELIKATYASLEKGHTGIAYHFKAEQSDRLLHDIKMHQIQKIWCTSALRQDIQKILPTLELDRLLI